MKLFIALLFISLNTHAGFDTIIGNRKGLDVGIIATPRHLAASGNIQDVTMVNRPGLSTTCSTSERDIWSIAGSLSFLTTESFLEVLSSSANDTSAGTGARIVRLEGVDQNYNQVVELITLNGTTPVQTVNKFLRSYSAMVVSSGSNNANAGTITIRVAGAGATQNSIVTGFGRSLNTHFTVPAGYSAYTYHVFVSASKNADIIMKLKTKSQTGNIMVNQVLYVYDSMLFINSEGSLRIPEKTDIWATCQTSTGTAAATGSLSYILVKNP